MALITSERTYVDVVDADGHRFDLVDLSVEVCDRNNRGGLSFPSLIIRWCADGAAFSCSWIHVALGTMRFAPRPQQARAHVAKSLEAA